ncbi:tyrosine-type recombinase/integrase [Deinococcus apachensis]|uniref:tyrosine-type recombinase/integrase n=1 Tax=Deinococcus apachensis TaxID=309886 RepID=UPI000367BBA1|nr:site-specific integrase [Deinococcus apachensis]
MTGDGRAKGRNGWHKGNIEELPSGRFRWRVWVTYPDGTRERRQGTVRTKTEAQRAIITAQKEAQEGVRPVSDRLTVGEMVTEYMAAKAGSWAPRTLWNNEKLYQRHVSPHLAHLKAAGVTPRALRAYFEGLNEKRPDPATGKTRPPLGDSAQRQIHVLLTGAYKRAIGDGLLRENPAQHARPVKAAKAGLAKVKAFTPEELGRFIGAALEDRWALPLAFLAYTGLRIGEALALTWADLQEDTKAPGVSFVTVSKTRSEFEGKAYTGKPKTAAGVRRVYLPGEARQIVEDMRRRVGIEARASGYQGEGLAPHAPIFPSVDGRPMRQDTARHTMRRTCETAGVPLLSPHALRHSVATFHLSQGRDVVTVAAHLGHAQTSTTLNTYAHALPDRLRGMTLDLATLRGETAKEEGQAEAAVPRLARKLGGRGRKGGPRRG